MDLQAERRIVRAAYAKQILAAACVSDPRLAEAFAVIPREDFLGPGPWLMWRWTRYVPTPDADPVYLYTNDLVALVAERYVNNGQPSLHAYLMHQARPAAGQHVVHVGTGTGYYTAILAHLVGPSGRVTGIEYDPELAAKARACLAPYPNVTIIEGDGAQVPFDAADIIYVNAGCTRPAARWLDNLADGGRLILPMTSDKGVGASLNESSGPAPYSGLSAVPRSIAHPGYIRSQSFPAQATAMRSPSGPLPGPSTAAAGTRSRGCIAIRRFPTNVAGFADRIGVLRMNDRLNA